MYFFTLSTASRLFSTMTIESFHDDEEAFSRLKGTFLSLHHYGFWNPRKRRGEQL
jgi:hypothetical protein